MNTKGKKIKYMIDLRKRDISDAITSARKQRNPGLLGFDNDYFNNTLKDMFERKNDEAMVLAGIKEVRRLAEFKDFKLDDKVLSNDFMFHIEEILTKHRQNVDIIIQLTYFMVCLFGEENFSVALGEGFMATLNMLATHDNSEVISNLMEILINFTCFEVGAKLVLYKFELSNLDKYILDKNNALSVAIEHYADIAYNLVSVLETSNHHLVG